MFVPDDLTFMRKMLAGKKVAILGNSWVPGTSGNQCSSLAVITGYEWGSLPWVCYAVNWAFPTWMV